MLPKVLVLLNLFCQKIIRYVISNLTLLCELTISQEFSQLLRDLENQILTFINGILKLQAPPLSTTVCQNCYRAIPLFSCLDCAPLVYECQDCIVKYHQRHPFHHINQYTLNLASGSWYFNWTTLDDLGFIYYLGHSGHHCSQALATDIKMYTVINNNGIHYIKILACACPTVPSLLSQLAMAWFLPATTERPQTLFTHKVLNSFYHHTHESGATAYAYFKALRWITNDVHHDLVQVCTIFLRWRQGSCFFRVGTESFWESLGYGDACKTCWGAVNG